MTEYLLMRRRVSARNLLLTAASGAIALATISPALAQDTAPSGTVPGGPSADEEDIIVTGIRGSLQRNLDIKRDAPGVIDAISAEDIGKFPDSNVAASRPQLADAASISRPSALTLSAG